MDVIGAIKELGIAKKHSRHNDDLFIDRLNYRYCVSIITVFCVIITAKQYFGDPINCWVPGHFTGNYAEYTNRICYVSSTYNIPISEELPESEPDRKVKLLKYYQWTPFILLFQAMLFFLPRLIWRSLSDKSGLDLQALVDIVYKNQVEGVPEPKKKELVVYLTNSFREYLNSRSNNHYAVREPGYRRQRLLKKSDDDLLDETDDLEVNVKETGDGGNKTAKQKVSHIGKIFCLTKGKRYGNYLLVLFVFVKILYTINSVTQLFVLNHFLGNNYILLGWEVFSNILAGEDWTQVHRFPRVTMCDFRIREVGIVHRYSVQCVLSINLFNEKIFIFIWFLLFLVSWFNVLNLISWIFTLMVRKNENVEYIRRRLAAIDPTQGFPRDKLKEFVVHYLKEDGVLGLRLLSRNVNDLVVSHVLFRLYKSFSYSYDERQVEYKRGSIIMQRPDPKFIDGSGVNDKLMQENELSPSNK